MKLLSGPVAAMVTPFRKDGAVDTRKIPKLLRFLYDRGITGIWACGTSGEVMSLSVEERQRILEVTVKETAGYAPVVAHVGHPSTAVSVKLARHARRVGATALAACPPYPPMPTFQAILAHYQAIAAAGELPFYAYMVSILVPVELTVGMVARIAKHLSVVGIKWTSADVQAVERLRRLAGGGLNVMSGFDELALACQAMGADGSVGLGHNAMPEGFAALHELMSQEKVAAAHAQQAAYNDFSAALPAGANIFARAKEVLRLRGIDVGTTRMPTQAPDATARKAIARAWERYATRSAAAEHLR
ncbi:MAG: dihydrodipicolinate synthase family protein [Planctomycetota bacterium]